MTQVLAAPEVVTFADLRSLAGASQPCITVALSFPEPLQIESRLNHALHAIERRLSDASIDPDKADALMRPIRELAGAIRIEEVWSSALIIFRAPGIFRSYAIPSLRGETLTVERRFQIRPVLSLLGIYQEFYLLALSQKHVRLFDCSLRRCEEIDLGRGPRNLLDWMNTDPPDHLLANRSVAGRAGAMKGVVFTTSSDREKQDEYLRHFFKQVDNVLLKLRDRDDTPLVVFGVEYETALFREVSRYPDIAAEVHGSPDGLPPSEVHRRCVETIARRHSPALRKALADLETLGGTPRVLTDDAAIVKAAAEGRVSDLLIRGNAEYRGTFNEETFEVERRADGEDLLNLAALQTLAHRGRAFTIGAQDLPGIPNSAALLRF